MQQKPDDNEIHFCKGKREAMMFISMWLKEHAETAKGALEDGVSHEKVLKRTIRSIEIIAKLLDENLKDIPRYISARMGAS